jgi:predicted dehydrogenase
MAREYIKVFVAEEISFEVIGNTLESCELFTRETGFACNSGSISGMGGSDLNKFEGVIVCVPVDVLSEVCAQLVVGGCRRILVEKPAGSSSIEIEKLLAISEQYFGTNILVAYNRRFYNSVIDGERLIAQDGGVTSVQFDFTEWAHVIRELGDVEMVKRSWLIANSSHVLDLVFFIAGNPHQISCQTRGSLDWHPSSAVFTGSGVTDLDVPFSYHSNWASAGRWSIEICTPKRKLIYRPMEELQMQNVGSLGVETIPSSDLDDVNFKPGLRKQTIAFVANELDRFCTLRDQLISMRLYEKIAGYS